MKFNEKEMGDCENCVIFALLKNNIIFNPLNTDYS